MTRSLFFACLLIPSLVVADETPPTSYDEHVQPILRKYCFKCHGDDKQEADLNMQSYATFLKGGSGGKAVVAGRSSQSLIIQAVTNPDEDVRMPPNSPPLPQETVAMIAKWIDSGLRESSGSKSMVTARDITFQPAAGAGAKPTGPPAMPENLPQIPLPQVNRPLPALAMDASPWAPLLAVSAQEHVRLIDTETEQPIGALAFPEGLPNVIRFSRDGNVLMVAGGRPVESGKVVLFDVKTGKRLAEIGDEIDAVLAADLSHDQRLIAFGGSGKVVKVYSTRDGQLQYKITKHTDWITAVAFSPDGTKLATADRAGGIHLWEPGSGGILLTLAEHDQAVRALDWRSDSKLLASAGEDGRVIWWDVSDGWPAISKPNAHPPRRAAGVYGRLLNGVLTARFDRDGDLVTAGRDRVVRVWTADGSQKATFNIESALPISTAISFDGNMVISGDSLGSVRFWKLP